MTNLDRGAYDSDRLHDFDADETSDDTEKSRLPLLVLIALVVLAAFGGVVWLAYTQGVERGRADVPRIAAAQSRSSAPKSQPSPYAGLNIYQTATQSTSDSGNSSAAPPLPQPLAARHRTSAPPALRPSAAARQEPPLPTPSVALSHPLQQSPPAQQAAQQDATLAPKETKPEQAPPPVQAATARDADISATPSKNGGVLLQIGSYKSDSEAMHSWNAFKARHIIAAAYQPDVQKVDLGAKGTWYRLRLGGLADKKSAIVLCERLKAQGGSCIIAR